MVSYQGNLGYGKNYSLQSGLAISLGIYSVALHSFIRSLCEHNYLEIIFFFGSVLFSFFILNVFLQYSLQQYGRIPVEWAAVYGTSEDVEILFPFTSPIQSVTNWSVDGIINHMKLERKQLEVCHCSNSFYLCTWLCNFSNIYVSGLEKQIKINNASVQTHLHCCLISLSRFRLGNLFNLNAFLDSLYYWNARSFKFNSFSL